jgi:hypothetical protein
MSRVTTPMKPSLSFMPTPYGCTMCHILIPTEWLHLIGWRSTPRYMCWRRSTDPF